MNINEVYKIADAKESYTREEIFSAMYIFEKEYLNKSQKSYLRFSECAGLVNKNNEGITILFPIYNEEKSLPYLIKSLFQSYFPVDVRVHVIFFLNACTDRSFEILCEELSRYGMIREKSFDKRRYQIFQDNGIKNIYHTMDNLNLDIFESSTKGRVNAIKVACRECVSSSNKILMSFDADLILEPMAIYELAKYSLRTFIEEKKNVACSANVVMVNKKRLSSLESWLRDHGVWNDQKYFSLSGCSLVLNVEWALKNIVDVAVEDYAMGLIARYQGYSLEKVEDARLWGFKTNLFDDFKQLSRSIRGRYQLMKIRPELKEMIEKDHYFMRSAKDRLEFLTSSMRNFPQNSLKILWRYFFTEIALLSAKNEFRKNPLNSDWEKLSSSR